MKLSPSSVGRAPEGGRAQKIGVSVRVGRDVGAPHSRYRVRKRAPDSETTYGQEPKKKPAERSAFPMSLRIILASILLTVVYSVASAQVPLPTDLSIQPPGTGVPADDAAFSGAWGNGAWEGSTPTALIVEQVDAEGTAKVIYARG